MTRITINAAHADMISRWLHTFDREQEIPNLTRQDCYDLEETPVSKIRELLNKHPDSRIRFNDNELTITRPLAPQEKQREHMDNIASRVHNAHKLAAACERDPKYKDQILTYLKHKEITIPQVNGRPDQPYRIYYTGSECYMYHETANQLTAAMTEAEATGDGFIAQRHNGHNWIDV